MDVNGWGSSSKRSLWRGATCLSRNVEPTGAQRGAYEGFGRRRRSGKWGGHPAAPGGSRAPLSISEGGGKNANSNDYCREETGCE